MYILTEYNVDGQSFWIPQTDGASYAYHTGTDRQNIDVALSHVPPERNKLCIQAGGNLGFFPLKFAERFETVITFEPDPQNFHCLCRNVQNDNVVKIQAALGNEYNWVDIVSPDPNHVGLCEISRVDRGANSQRVPTIRIDDLNVPACDLIQLDLEGYEFFALQGAEKTIRKFKPYLSIEMAGCEMRYGVEAGALSRLIDELGYAQIDSVWLDNIYAPIEPS